MSLSVELPLSRNSLEGFTLIKDFRLLTRQNLKMLLLTVPGERIMEPDFGVGLRRYLFAAKSPSTKIEIETRIREQVRRYLSIVSLQSIDILGIGEPDNRIFVNIDYQIIPIKQFDNLDFKFFTD